MRTIAATLAALITLLVPACELYSTSDDVPALDAGIACERPPSPRVSYCPSGFVPDRLWECLVLCADGIGVCEGAEVTACRRECEAAW